MQFSNREKELMWRALCDSENFERERISALSKESRRYSKDTREKMINQSRTRLKEIDDLKNKFI